MFSRISDYFKYKKQEKEEFIAVLDKLVQDITIAEQEFSSIFSHNNYIDVRIINNWKNKFSTLHDNASSYLAGGMIEKKKLPSKYEAQLKRIGTLYGLIDKRRKEHNKNLLSAGKAAAVDAFNKICPGYTPTEYQINAILADDKRILITGAPSTGKTTALIAKYEYLKSKGRSLLYFDALSNVKFADFSLELLSKSKERITYNRPDKNFLSKMIMQFIKEKLSDSIYRGRLIDYYFKFHTQGKTRFDFDRDEDYQKYILLCPPVTLKGEKVKSYEELEIADFLYCTGINYEYNAPFAKEAMINGARLRYKADFTLPDYGICINIYTMDDSGNAPFEEDGITSVDGLGNATAALNNRIEEIRNLHNDAEIPLIECYTYEKTAGNMLPRLQSALAKYNVNFNVKNDDEIIKLIQDTDKDFFSIITESIRLSMETILATGESEETILTLSRTKSKTSAPLYKRRERILSLVLPFYNYYIKNVEWDDFRIIHYAAKMLLNADKSLVDSMLNCQYLFVDNAESLNAASYQLLAAIVEKTNCKIVFAGCGWLSAVGINGTDPVYFQDFGRFFPGHDEILCDKTFNIPGGIYKQMMDFALNESGNYEYRPVYSKNTSIKTEMTNKTVTDFLKQLLSDNTENPSILVACRYEHELEAINQTINEIRKDAPSCHISSSTILNASGKYNIVLWVSTRYTNFGFPDERICLNNISDLILRRPDTNFFLGERNLLCKAISLTKERFIFICDNTDVSDYIEEIIKNPV